MHHMYTIELSIEEHIGYLPVMAAENNAGMNKGDHTSLQISIFKILG